MKLIKFTTMALLIAFVSLSHSTAQGFTNLSDCLVTNDIGKYTYKADRAYVMSQGSGVVGAADHFDLDHSDSLCDGRYSNINEVRGLPVKEFKSKSMSIAVQVTQHTGGDSDRWLLHEVEKAYRSSKSEKLGMIIQATRLREINGNKLIGRRGNGYTWVSNNVVVDISYTDLQGNKPEPLEVVQAYLGKFPSTISITDTIFKSTDYNIKWIKDEMDRRLWLCDKWNAQFQAGGVKQSDLIVTLVNNLDIFLQYRWKYFGVGTKEESDVLDTYQQSNDLASIQTKLTEYKTWWAKHKEKRISL